MKRIFYVSLPWAVGVNVGAYFLSVDLTWRVVGLLVIAVILDSALERVFVANEKRT